VCPRHVVIVVIAMSVVVGCASKPKELYQWGGYEQGLYAAYKDPVQVESLRVKLETLIAEMERVGQKVAPGLHAELGTIYLQMGATDKAIAQYAKERDAWSESRGLMTAMIQNLERRQQAREEQRK
jgi:hypothetical protein